MIYAIVGGLYVTGTLFVGYLLGRKKAREIWTYWMSQNEDFDVSPILVRAGLCGGLLWIGAPVYLPLVGLGLMGLGALNFVGTVLAVLFLPELKEELESLTE